MSRRFGRNQKRRMREELAAAYGTIEAYRDAYAMLRDQLWQANGDIMDLQSKLDAHQIMQNRDAPVH